MARLFISHASEDKDAFVRPLAESLRAEGHEVWYDEFVLRVGDNLRRKIEDGLRNADFAIVVLSPSFFQKQWTQRELDGLFALEQANEKLILPIWLGVSKEQVAQASPILAGYFAVQASLGLPAVVDALQNSIAASDRTREVVSTHRGVDALIAFSQREADTENEHQRLFSIPGAQAVNEAAVALTDLLIAAIERTVASGGKPRFSARKYSTSTGMVNGPHGVFAQTSLSRMALNSALDAEYSVRFGQRAAERFPNSQEPADELEELIFKPRMSNPDAVQWDETSSSDSGQVRLASNQQVVDRIIERLLFHIEKRRR